MLYRVKADAVLWRGNGLHDIQPAHQDAHAGSFQGIEALTDGYRLRKWTRSHLLPLWSRRHRATLVGNGSNVIMDAGDVLLMHCNLLHGGAMSHRCKSNGSKLMKKFHKIDPETLKEIKWFKGAAAMKDVVVTDMSLHFAVDHVQGQQSERDLETNGNVVEHATHYNKNSCDDVQYSKLEKEYNEKIDRGYEEYREMMMPGGVTSEKKPCSTNIGDANNALDYFVKGKLPVGDKERRLVMR